LLDFNRVMTLKINEVLGFIVFSIVIGVIVAQSQTYLLVSFPRGVSGCRKLRNILAREHALSLQGIGPQRLHARPAPPCRDPGWLTLIFIFPNRRTPRLRPGHLDGFSVRVEVPS
jgi:hypothetical protein